MPESDPLLPPSRVWAVGALCRAVADALDRRFNPVEVAGEISGFVRVASGHCYFTLKDESGQLKCAMFRRAASMLDFSPRDGASVLVRARLGVYEPRGDLQLVVEGMALAGEGAQFERFLRLKAKLEAEGLFDAGRKRGIPPHPRSIGLVTSLAGAALHDVATVLRRRAPHVPVALVPASVQGAGAAQDMVRALAQLFDWSAQGSTVAGQPPIDLILLVRGGGSLDDLWAFNDELLARTIAASPVPVIAGVGHETDFTIADFVADLRAPTPTAAAELATQPRERLLEWLDNAARQLRRRTESRIEGAGQSLDHLGSRLARPSTLLLRQRMLLGTCGRQLSQLASMGLRNRLDQVRDSATALRRQARRALEHEAERLSRLALRLDLTDPRQVLRRGYVWVTGPGGRAVTRLAAVELEANLSLQFVDGKAEARVTKRQPE